MVALRFHRWAEAQMENRLKNRPEVWNAGTALEAMGCRCEARWAHPAPPGAWQ